MHPLERAVLPLLKDKNEFSDVVKESGLQEVEAMRAIQWLENKGAVKVHARAKDLIVLDSNGEAYIRQSLPEKRLLQALERPLTMQEIQQDAKLDKDELAISLGVLKKKNAIAINEKVTLTEEGKRLLIAPWPEEEFLNMLPCDAAQFSPQQQEIYHEFQKRKRVIATEKQQQRTITLTQLGRRLQGRDLSKDYLGQLTHAMLKAQSWRGKEFRRYDVSINVPRIYPSRRHITSQAREYIKRIWLDLGFKEMTGPLLDTSFWNFDALFVPQDHPAREAQDTFYVEGRGTLPSMALVSRVRKAHEAGHSSASRGWQYKWEKNRAKELVLRTHTTLLSARTLAAIKQTDHPAKYFAIGRCFRNEALDWSHLFEFDQTEGIVIDENANFKHLIGYLKEFFKKMGFSRVRFRPGFFPYVEPGLECEVYHPTKKRWIELGGAGVFRPEVTSPLMGREIPVLAWGLGLGRIIMEHANIHDLRDLYRNDLKQLRERTVWR